MGLCPHRGHQTKSGKCPYHGLTFPADFKCLSKKPGEHTVADHSEIMKRLVTDMNEEYFSYSQWVNAPFYLWIQNTMDPNHLESVHPAFSKVVEGAPYCVRFSEDLGTSSYKIRVSDPVREKFEKLSGKILVPHFFHMVAYPNVSITSFLDVFYSVEYAMSDGAQGCKVHTRFLTSKSNPVPKALSDSTIEPNIQILKEDKDICESWARTYHQHAHKNWLPGEDRIRAYLHVLEANGFK